MIFQPLMLKLMFSYTTFGLPYLRFVYYVFSNNDTFFIPIPYHSKLERTMKMLSIVCFLIDYISYKICYLDELLFL